LRNSDVLKIIPTDIMGRLVMALALLCSGVSSSAQEPAFRVIAAATRAEDHAAMIAAARPFLTQLGTQHNFAIDFTQDVSRLDDATLAGYGVLLQLQLAPFEVPPAQRDAFQRFIERGGGWVGIHAAGLTGRQFLDAKTVYWKWFEDYFGGVVYSPHPAFQKATVDVEDRNHPAMKNLPATFEISDEWYEFDRSPRPNVRVLGTVDEGTYKQTRPMGDHPIIWSNEKYGRMIYIGIGHSPEDWADRNYTTLVRDAVVWAGSGTPRAKSR
jgi:type 1 glutamine amidotransferase